MPNAVHETSAVTATVFATRFQPDPPGAIISEEPECAWNAPEQPACDSEPRCHETQTELASASRVAFLGQLSASIAEINQPISAVVMNAEAALRLPSPSRQIRKQSGGCSLVSSRTECALATSLTAPVR
jgi:hypothetical protein